MHKKNMLLFLSFGFGGAEGRLIQIAQKALHTGDVLCINSDFLMLVNGRPNLKCALDNMKDRGILKIIPAVPSVFSRFSLLKYLWVLSFGIVLILKEKPTFFHAALGGILLTPIAKFMGAYTLVELTSPDNVDFFQKFAIYLKPFLDSVVCVSPSVYSRFISKSPELDKMTSIYPIPFYEPRSARVVPDEIVTIAFCARLIRRKNGLLFAQSIKHLYERRQDFKVLLMGDGDESAEIFGEVGHLVDLGVVRLGRVNYPFGEFLKSDIFVSLIEPDNYPSQSVLEAMNAENALVLSNTGHSNLYLGAKNGVLVELDVSHISKQLSDMIENRDEVLKMGRRSKELLFEAFSPHLFIKSLESLYSLDNK